MINFLDQSSRKLILRLIYFYQKFLSPLWGGQCRFYPTCSEYAKQVYLRFNFFRATQLTIWRLLRCQPFCTGGEDIPPSR